MKNKLFFLWLKNTLGLPRRQKRPAGAVADLWLKKRRVTSLVSQEIPPRRLQASMANLEHRMEACPIAPLQEQMQAVWFHLVHEYIKTKRNGGNHDSSCPR